MSSLAIRAARFDEMRTRVFHDIVRLRVDTFVVEQHCAYAELDGRDVLDTTEHLWIETDGEPVSYLRTYPAADGAICVGRVVTALPHRGRGLATQLMRHVLERAVHPVRVAAQAHLAGWYGALGFERSGPDYIEDGVLHTPMRLDPPNGSCRAR